MASHILLTDNDEWLRRRVALSLDPSGYRVSIAAALGLARRDPPDLVLLDMGLPGKD